MMSVLFRLVFLEIPEIQVVILQLKKIEKKKIYMRLTFFHPKTIN